jgi:hypothetical protein
MPALALLEGSPRLDTDYVRGRMMKTRIAVWPTLGEKPPSQGPSAKAERTTAQFPAQSETLAADSRNHQQFFDKAW